jgi:uncharacterized protein YbjT (DUF2867 family)
MKPRKILIAGASGSVGRNVVGFALQESVPFVSHYRPGKTPSEAQAVSFPLEDKEALAKALDGCTTILQLIGTMRKRFSRGDTYEASDINTTRLLGEAGRAANVDHFVLLSSVGAGRPVGDYLKAKAKAEALAQEFFPSTYTIVRPSMFQGEGFVTIPGAKTLTRLLSLRQYEPIEVRELAQTLWHIAKNRMLLRNIVEGETLWGAVEAARLGGES